MPRIRRSRPLALLAAAALGGSLLAGCGDDDRMADATAGTEAPGQTAAATGGSGDRPQQSAQKGAQPQAVTVLIKDFKYGPPTIRVPAGSTIRFENGDTQAHTATAKEKAFDTDRIEPDMGMEITVETAGSIAYFCAYHPFMQGVIEVQ